MAADSIITEVVAMTTPTANIVQAAFFHVDGGKDHSLKELHRQIRERFRDSFRLVLATGKEAPNGIKTGVRFYDTNGSVTRQVQDAQRLEDDYTATLDVLSTTAPGSLRRRRFGRKLRKIATKKQRSKVKAIKCSVRAFRNALKTK